MQEFLLVGFFFADYLIGKNFGG